MGGQSKILFRLQTKPTDFSWNELKAMMKSLGFELKMSAGSRRKFIHMQSRATHFIHEPHPSKTLKAYQVRDLIAFLKKEGFTE